MRHLIFKIFSPLIFIFMIHPAMLLAATPAEVPIKQIKVEGLYTISGDELIYLLCLRDSNVIVPENLNRGIKRAFKKGIFEYISVGQDDKDPGIVIISVREKDRIKNIRFRVKGASISKGFLEDNLLLKKRGFMRYDLAHKAESALKETLSGLGYPDATVKLTTSRPVKAGKNPYLITVNVSIETGKPVFIKKVEVVGRPAGEVRKYLKISAGGVYDQYKLRAQINALHAYYIKKNYLDPSVGPYSFSDGVLYINVVPGQRYRVFFYGNHKLGEKALTALLPFSEAGAVRDDLIEEAVQKIKDAYAEKGHPYVQVAPVWSEQDGADIVKFHIFEDGQIKVSSVSFAGSTLPSNSLEDFLALRKGQLYNPDLIETDRSNIQDFYASLGYLDASVPEPVVTPVSPQAVSITYHITEGRKYLAGQVDVTGEEPALAGRIMGLINIKPGDIYNEIDITNAKYRVLEFYNDRGYADCRVDIKRDFSGNNGKVKLVYTIEPGQKFFFGKNVVAGNVQTKLRVIKRELLHKEGDPFSQKVLLKERQRLYELGIFQSVDVSELPVYNAKFDTVYRVKESKPGAVEIGAGYGEYEKYRGFLGLSYNNLFGMNRTGSATLEASSIEKRAILSYLEPWFFGRELPFRGTVLLESRTQLNFDTRQISYKLIRYSGSAGVEKKLTNNIKGELYYEFSLVRTYDLVPGVVLSREDVGTIAISAIRPALEYDTRDNPFDPRSGVLAGATFKFASAAFFSQTNFAKMVLRAAKYQAVSRRLVVAVDGRVGLAEGLGQTRELPIVERFFLGGRDSVRGYTQDSLGPIAADGTPIGGNAFFAANLELRQALTRSFSIVPFLDAGNVWPTIGRIRALDIRFATGLGVRFKTPVGPLRLDYGIKLSRREGESKTKIDFSIGHAF